ncbi:NAD-dependent succinate-semialdehyde dehydrogenase [Pararhizobium mangrovi]|uniref:NAD-dependent succinate-semialdehyde dehydrogenase n=1 Tax=Pararhizobium mangrovi TaxID=2590452 RepID=A0A506UHN7_9HYPH|nr:NAD-dependent succinate-semialdehyde dehydrogenase [Pararhizobium mangrovi]TPW32819.1 NAD-dependent succinate-semialdehyde dehydrogenase [Pararhizobium mangrovi]
MGIQATDLRKTVRSADLGGLADPRLLREFAYIDGEWRAHEDGHTFDVADPAARTWLASVPALGEQDATRAVDAAARAFPDWSGLIALKRAAVLRQWHALVIEAMEDLALIMSLEQGKPISEARGEIAYAADFIDYYAQEAKRLSVESITPALENAEFEVTREPVGVAALVTPWNFPSAMLTRKAAAALAAGCTVVCHPASETPLSALALAELADRAGFPAGVFNVVTGAPEPIVSAWSADMRVRALSFTGSTGVGQKLYRDCADTMKRLVMELGGHAPFLVFGDADVDKAVEAAMIAKFATSGQDCLAANRILVEAPLYDEFCEKFARRTAELTVGRGLTDPDIGPMMHERAVEKLVAQVEDAVGRGAKVLVGGHRHAEGPLFFEPTVLAGVDVQSLIFHEETFGPVAAIASFDDEEEAVRRANDTDYGLVAYLHTQDAARIARISRALQYGMVAVNRTKITGAPIPFGGVKLSGLGREGSRHGMEAFTDIKYVCRDIG